MRGGGRSCRERKETHFRFGVHRSQSCDPIFGKMDEEITQSQEERREEEIAGLSSLSFDRAIYRAGNRFDGYGCSIPVNEEEDEQDQTEREVARKPASYTAPRSVLSDDFGFSKPQEIIDREDDYRKRRLNRIISPERNDAFAMGQKTLDATVRTCAHVKRDEAVKQDKEDQEETERKEEVASTAPTKAQAPIMSSNRWDQSIEQDDAKRTKTSDWDATKWDATPMPGRTGIEAIPGGSGRKRWDETPTAGHLADSGSTPTGGFTPDAMPAGMNWDATPKVIGLVTPTPKKQWSRWDETPMAGAIPNVFAPGSPPVGSVDLATPTPTIIQLRGAITPEQYNLLRWEREIEERNRPLSDEELNVPREAPGGLPFMKPEDYLHFGSLLNEDDEESLTPEESKERKIMKLLLMVKNGTPPQRKTALCQLTDKAREFGAGPLFNQILPLLMSPTLEDQERHLLVKLINRLLYKLDELVRPFVHKVFVVIEPLLVDEDYYARAEGREIISNLSKAAGLATMITAMRPDVDNIDEFVRNTTAIAFSVVASAQGIPALLPFLKAVCQSKKSWQARHTGIKIVQPPQGQQVREP